MLVTRSREDYCNALYSLAQNSEKVASEMPSLAAIVRAKLLATLHAHPLWDVDAQANSFQVRASCHAA
jgi:hypothetical protein